MGVTFAESSDKHGIPRDVVMDVIANAREVHWDFEEPRPGFATSPTLFIGDSRFGEREVLALIGPGRRVHIMHVMPLRESTKSKVAEL